jgi:hypothetical protein
MTHHEALTRLTWGLATRGLRRSASSLAIIAKPTDGGWGLRLSEVVRRLRVVAINERVGDPTQKYWAAQLADLTYLPWPLTRQRLTPNEKGQTHA